MQHTSRYYQKTSKLNIFLNNLQKYSKKHRNIANIILNRSIKRNIIKDNIESEKREIYYMHIPFFPNQEIIFLAPPCVLSTPREISFLKKGMYMSNIPHLMLCMCKHYIPISYHEFILIYNQYIAKNPVLKNQVLILFQYTQNINNIPHLTHIYKYINNYNKESIFIHKNLLYNPINIKQKNNNLQSEIDILYNNNIIYTNNTNNNSHNTPQINTYNTHITIQFNHSHIKYNNTNDNKYIKIDKLLYEHIYRCVTNIEYTHTDSIQAECLSLYSLRNNWINKVQINKYTYKFVNLKRNKQNNRLLKYLLEIVNQID